MNNETLRSIKVDAPWRVLHCILCGPNNTRKKAPVQSDYAWAAALQCLSVTLCGMFVQFALTHGFFSLKRNNCILMIISITSTLQNCQAPALSVCVM